MSLSKYVKVPSDKIFLSNRNYSDILFVKLCLKEKFNYSKYIINKKDLIKKIEYNSDKKTYKKRINKLEEGGYLKNHENEIEICHSSIKYMCKIPKDIALKMANTNIENIIKVYIILRIFYENNKESWFSYNRLALQLGYKNINETSTNIKIKKILSKLVELELIEYKIEYSEKYKCNRFKILNIRKENIMNKKNLTKTISDIRELTGASIKEIAMIIKEFELKKYNPSRIEIIQVIKYKRLCSFASLIGKEDYKKIDEYIDKIIENGIKTKAHNLVTDAIKKGLITNYSDFCESDLGKGTALTQEEIEFYTNQYRKENNNE